MRILGLDHISVATDSIERQAAFLENLFGIRNDKIEENPNNKIRLSFLNFGNVNLELIQPLDENSPISKFLQNRGPGIHHICLRVENIEQALEELRSKGVKLIDEHPRRGAEGSKIAFIHPDSTGGILIELKQT